jgi:hypothetical protein
MIRTLLAAIALTLAFAVLADQAEPASLANAGRSCPVTMPTREVPPGAGFTAAGFNYGGAHLRAHLYWPNGTLTAGILPDGGSMAIINSDGSIYVKVGWWLGLPGRLVVTGRRLDAPPLPLRARVPGGYGSRGFQPTFPTVGCWRVTGKLGRARLSFTVSASVLSRPDGRTAGTTGRPAVNVRSADRAAARCGRYRKTPPGFERLLSTH